jgi:hypothetical protein
VYAVPDASPSNTNGDPEVGSSVVFLVTVVGVLSIS